MALGSVAPVAKREAAVIAGVAVGGAAALAVMMAWSYALARSRAGNWDPALWQQLVSWLGWMLPIPVVAHVGGRQAPHRVRAVVVAAVGAWVLFVLAFNGVSLFGFDRRALRIAAANGVLIALAVVAARSGARRARPDAVGAMPAPVSV